jgi:guanine nucleotide-binding protein G(I)/G(S)/G(T) subunit beta-1
MAEVQKQIAEAKGRLETLKKEIESVKSSKSDRSLMDTIRQRQCTDAISCAMRTRRILRGHFGKVYAVHWSGDSTHLLSASQDGKLMIWNGLTTNKLQSIPLTSSWVITCAFEQMSNTLVACGGMDNICSLYKVEHYDQNKVIRVAQELSGHHGYLSSCCFIDQNNILTASGDSTCNLWDIERGRPIRIFREHSADVMSVCASKTDPNIFASGSCDTTAKVPFSLPSFHPSPRLDLGSEDTQPQHSDPPRARLRCELCDLLPGWLWARDRR